MSDEKKLFLVTVIRETSVYIVATSIEAAEVIAASEAFEILCEADTVTDGSTEILSAADARPDVDAEIWNDHRTVDEFFGQKEET